MSTAVQALLRAVTEPRLNSSSRRNETIIEKFSEILAAQAGQPVAALQTLSVPATWRPHPPSEGAGGSTSEPETGGAQAAIEQVSRDSELGDDRGSGEDPLHPNFDPCTRRGAEVSLDPMLRVLSACGLGLAEPSPPSVAGPPPFVELWGRFVRRVAWGGDGRRGTARIEIAEGEWAGARIVVHAVERQVRVEIELPAGACSESCRERLAGRLRDRGIDVTELTVR